MLATSMAISLLVYWVLSSLTAEGEISGDSITKYERIQVVAVSSLPIVACLLLFGAIWCATVLLSRFGFVGRKRE